MDPKIAKKTQDTLGKIIKKPPLTDKLLAKPPFRFLHDIVTSVIKTTGFMKGLYAESELNSENVKDKDSKIAFLQKAVDLVSLVNNKTLSVKPQKVVAGHEPEKTNEFLQALATAISKKVDNDEYVAKVLGKGNVESKAEEKKDREKDKDKEKTRERSEDRRKRDDDKRDKEKERGRDSGSRDRERDRSRDKDDRHRDRDADRKSARKMDQAEFDILDSLSDDMNDLKTSDILSDELNTSDSELASLQNNSLDVPLNMTFDTNLGAHGLDEKEIQELEEQRRQQWSRARANRPKAARPRREHSSLTNLNQTDSQEHFESQKSSGDSSESKGKEVAEIAMENIGLETNAAIVFAQKEAKEDVEINKSDEKVGKKETQNNLRPKDSKRNMGKKEAKEDVGKRQQGAAKSRVTTRPKENKSATQAVTKIPSKPKQRRDSVGPRTSTPIDSPDSVTVIGKPRPKESSSKKIAENKTKSNVKKSGDRSLGEVVSSIAPIERTSEIKIRSESKQTLLTKGKSKGKLNFETIPLSKSKTEVEKDIIQVKPADVDMTSESHTSSSRKEDVTFNVYKKKKRKVEDKRRKSSFSMLANKRREDDEGKENETPDMVNGEKEPPPARMQRPSSAKGSRRRQEAPVTLTQGQDSSEDEDGGSPTRKPQAAESSVKEDDVPPQVAETRRTSRPASARPAPPRRKEDTIQSEPSMRLGSGKPTNVIVDNEQGSDEDETFVVEESAPPPPEPEKTTTKMDVDEDEDHGALVKNIMKTKKEYEAQQTKKTDIDRSTLSDAQRRKQREQIQKEIDKLRGSIQTLTRSANPLGKIMDYVQEDLDSMQKELEKWKTENKEHAQALKRETAITERAVEPLKAQLTEVDQQIKDQMDLIAAVKSNILRNDQKIEKMLRTIAKS
ncbi:hypothetical protein ACJMK2_022581 [Sinanodonta woodiana]|uniref:TRAF3-interacting protein 1 n=1 Tax=Sinanodonta woodiana TaxID=1069815 RepID=A0ABD3TKK0_SINWO